MGHGKLRKFRENETFSCLLQPMTDEILDVSQEGSFIVKDHQIKGNWGQKIFGNDRPIILELGCGRGEYTIDLALRNPQTNYIGVDIKGARLWKGAKYASENKLANVAFLRTRIEFIEAFFAPEEVSEIWLTFSDPQLKSENSRLTSPRFLERYRKFLKPSGLLRLKTDSRFLHEYSKAVAMVNNLEISACTTDLYGSDKELLLNAGESPALFEVQTFYEKMFLEQGLKITYLAFNIDKEGAYLAPLDFDNDLWKAVEGKRRSFGHQINQ